MKTREQAMQWWNNLPLFVKESKHHYSDKYYPNRGHNNLTGREIEEIWKCEQLNEAFEKDNVKIRVIPNKENIYLNRLKEQYKTTQKSVLNYNRNLQDYLAMRLFCLDTQLISFNDIEQMESEINSSF